ncbi:MAG TPA: putative Na+/H+ antiporter [Opitutaceae bacterium]|nr:putative Na+/H+ antiporter [Opitutaceae bacterium]HWC00484.1 putative Na+/H+ antiporter [Bryobacteraceae bacterium]
MSEAIRHAMSWLSDPAAGPVSVWSAAGAVLPTPLGAYQDPEGAGLWRVLAYRAGVDPLNVVALLIFAAAIVHTFFTAKIRRWAHRIEERHAARPDARGPGAAAAPDGGQPPDEVSFPGQVLHFLGEIEAVFGLWAVVLALAITWLKGGGAAVDYLSNRVSYTEPMFVVIVMALAATRPVLALAEACLRKVARLGRGTPGAWWLTILILAPLVGSLITEPAAMTIAALLLARQFYALSPSPRFAYATIGLLFVNVSVGGTLTHFAAPPVIMVAHAWGWGLPQMLGRFGWRAVVGIVVSTLLYYAVFRRELAGLAENRTQDPRIGDERGPAPAWVTLVQLGFLAFTVWQAHHPVLFVGGFLFFLAFAQATAHHQSPMDLRAPILVGFFLAGLVIHGGLQAWWIEPILGRLGERPLFFAATGLTAFNDNAAITYLASLVPRFSDALKYAVVAGAVTGGGLTVIANAPNPAGQTILARYFPGGVSPAGLFLGAAAPTAILSACFLIG